MPDYSVRIAGDHLIFSAAHFIMLPGGICEPLHGHNYRVAVELGGPLDEIDCVIDFHALREIMKSILAELDHAVLLPMRHSAIRVSVGEGEVEVRFGSPLRFSGDPADRSQCQAFAELVMERVFSL